MQAITDRTWPRPSPVDPATRGLAGRSYEAFQPPLYYVVAAPAFLLAGDHLTKVKVLRAFDLRAAAGGGLRCSGGSAGASRPPGRWSRSRAALTVLLWPGVLVRGGHRLEHRAGAVLATALLLVLWRLLEQPGRRLLLTAALLLGACLLPSRR